MKMNRKAIWGVPFAAVAVALLAVSAAYACTSFNGSFTVTGVGSTTVTADGTDLQDVPGMSQTISGTTSAGATGGSIVITTGVATNGTKLPPSNGQHKVFNANVGPYDVNYFNGAAYATDTWVVDCMSYSVQQYPAGSGYYKLGTVTVDGSGVAQGSAVARTFALPTSVPNPLGGISDSAVCISDATGFWGNEAPVTIV